MFIAALASPSHRNTKKQLREEHMNCINRICTIEFVGTCSYFLPFLFYFTLWWLFYPLCPCNLPYLTLRKPQAPLPLPAAPMGLAYLTACSNICLFPNTSRSRGEVRFHCCLHTFPLTIFQSFVCELVLTSICCGFSLIKRDYLWRTFKFLCCERIHYTHFSIETLFSSMGAVNS